MKYTQLQDTLFDLKTQIAEIDRNVQALKTEHSLTDVQLGEEYTFTARWRQDPETGGVDYSLKFKRKKETVGEVIDESLFTQPSVPKLIVSRMRHVRQLLKSWLDDEIEWPFSEEEFPRATP